ncbi:ABC transporter substrate-binding protein [Allokutzneria sp. A3M-2-11 16]|uniref:ABC transporter substrate-binding protein n=1 Tax=Allokutzneria sp. A3M-2-11 16 TaxID=2962043 RepID=UPI0020B879D2|nr:ABC transporter substrate-binding protein [Allokutzneria sp. A3M-2-11 16]MCP3800080.1 ABC transporter substrate-binding protein [Allokutzneria sp. A3M-2-11 16]
MTIRAFRRASALLASAVVLASVSGCGLFTSTEEAAAPKPERGTLRIGVLPSVDVAPLYLARNEKLFSAAGLQVELIVVNDDNSAVQQLESQTLDIAFASHVTLLRAVHSGKELQLQGEAYQAARNTMALVTLADSDYDNPGEIQKPKIAVNRKDDLGTLTTESVLQTANVKKDNIKWSPIAFADMADALRNKSVDAAWMVEPWITKAQRSMGARVLTDTARGYTLDFPMSGYAASKKFADSYPKTLAAFRNVLEKAQELGTNKLAVQEVLTEYAEVDAQAAGLVSVGTYPMSINPVRLQRVADMMETSQLLTSRLDVQQLLPPARVS